MAHIDYYFTSASPFTYLGHKALMAVAAKHGASVSFRPVSLMGLWEVSGAVPPAKRPPVRQRYRLIELQRLAAWRGLKLNLAPAFWPVDPTLADHTIIAALEMQIDPTDYMFDLFAGVWANDENIADEAFVTSLLTRHGMPVRDILDYAASENASAVRQENTETAVAADAIGVPSYVLNGEVFWGQDRLELLDDAIASGRAPFLAG